MSGTFQGISARIRHWRNRLPPGADLRDVYDYHILDRFYYVSLPEVIIDRETGETNLERTYSLVAATSSGQRDGRFFEEGGCRANDDASGLPVPYDARLRPKVCSPPDPYFPPPWPPGSCFTLDPRLDAPAMPSGYVVKSYPILRTDTTGELAALFQEQAVVETRNILNVPVSVRWPGDCGLPSAAIQETYHFIGASPAQRLVAHVARNDTFAPSIAYAQNQELLFKGRRYFGLDYVWPADIEVASGPWAGATDVWVRHFNSLASETTTSSVAPDPLDEVREVTVYRAQNSRRSIPGLVR